MGEAQQTLAEQLAAPLIMLVLTSVVALVGWLLSRQLTFIEAMLKEHELRLDTTEDKVLLIQTHLGLKRPSDVVLKVSPPRSGESLA